MNNQELTLLSEGQIWGNRNESQLEVIRKYGTKAGITDLCILTGAYLGEKPDCNTGWFWTRSGDGNDNVYTVNNFGNRQSEFRYERNCAIRPVLKSSIIFSKVSSNRMNGYNKTEEVEYGEYPQNAVDLKMQKILESEYNRDLMKLGPVIHLIQQNGMPMILDLNL